jgi:2-keto-4-pentenoate hydratase/2-oxohepta-3-ene-1,7-dioic acid hydratase in catechol pathway
VSRIGKYCTLHAGDIVLTGAPGKMESTPRT